MLHFRYNGRIQITALQLLAMSKVNKLFSPLGTLVKDVHLCIEWFYIVYA